MSEGTKEPLTHAGLIAHKLAIEAEADVIGEQCNEDGASLKTVLQLLCYEIASSHVVQQRAVAKLRDFFDFAQPEPADAGPHAVGWRCTVEGARIGNLALRAQDRMVRGALALQRLFALIGGGKDGGTWTWARPDWLDAFPEMTPENLAKANAAQKAADERRKREAEEARRKRESETPKLHATPIQRRGRLKNGNPAGDYMAAPRCGAHTRSGTCCRQPAMSNGRCRFHGGLSTGPRTAEGLARSPTARFIHGGRTAEIIDLRSAAARSARRMKLLLVTAKQSLAANASFPHAVGEGRDGGLSANSPAGHGLDRSVPPAPLEPVALNHRDTEAQRDRVARVIPLHQEKKIIARPQAAQESRKASLLASTAAFTSPLCVSVPLWFKAAEHGPTASAPAGHGLDRSFSRHRLMSTAATPPRIVVDSRVALPHNLSRPSGKRRAVG
ncbi:MAG TPA: HGGxSTG domain-containing protein [Dongiaceae bacterium]|nr:HGGxSTG domain-containing protein [Dongiaceae bacterium]